MFVLDTNVVSELRRPARADRKVVAWASAVPLAEIFLSAITILEIELGALSIARRDAGAHLASLDRGADSPPLRGPHSAGRRGCAWAPSTSSREFLPISASSYCLRFREAGAV
jgi:predicted nucleic acid-binding protein